MTDNDILLLAIIMFFLGAACGVAGTMWYEDKYGKAVKEVNRLQQVILRMIPKLQPHYTNDYIYWELVNGNERRKGINPADHLPKF